MSVGLSVLELILPLFPLFFIRPGWSIVPVLWVSSLTVNLSVQQTGGAAPWLILKVRAAQAHSYTEVKTFSLQVSVSDFLQTS